MSLDINVSSSGRSIFDTPFVRGSLYTHGVPLNQGKHVTSDSFKHYQDSVYSLINFKGFGKEFVKERNSIMECVVRPKRLKCFYFESFGSLDDLKSFIKESGDHITTIKTEMSVNEEKDYKIIVSLKNDFDLVLKEGSYVVINYGFDVYNTREEFEQEYMLLAES